MANELRNSIAKKEAEQHPKNVKELLTSPSMKEQIAAALPSHMKPERMVRVMMTEMRKNPKLAACDPFSFMGAIMQLSQLGLEPGGALGHAYLIPFQRSVKDGNRWTKVDEVQLIVGYRGMLDLARRSGQIVSIEARVIYAKDKYNIGFGLDSTLEHVPAWHEADRGEPLFFYAVAKLKDGGTQFEVMSATEVNKIRDKSQGYMSAKKKAAENDKPIDHPWSNNYEEMGKKTVTRRLFKWLPVSIEIQRAVGIDEMAEFNQPQHHALLLEGDASLNVIGLDSDESEDEGMPSVAADPDVGPLTLTRLTQLMEDAPNLQSLDAAWDIGNDNGLTEGNKDLLDVYNRKVASFKKK